MFRFTTDLGRMKHTGRLDYKIDFETLESLEIYAMVIGRYNPPTHQLEDLQNAQYPVLPYILVAGLEPGKTRVIHRIGFVLVKEIGLGD